MTAQTFACSAWTTTDGAHTVAAVRIRVSHPASVDDLVRFLERMGFAAVECDYAAICVELGGERTAPEFRHSSSSTSRFGRRLGQASWQRSNPRTLSAHSAAASGRFRSAHHGLNVRARGAWSDLGSEL